MRVGVLIDQARPVAAVVSQVSAHQQHGFASALATQTFGYDAMTLLGAAAVQVPDIELGTAVVPVYSRLPHVMAQQALTLQAVSGGRFVLGIGMSHQVVVEGVWGLSFDRPVRYIEEYLSVLVPMLAGEAVRFEGEVVTARATGPLDVPGGQAPPVVVAALGPAMLRVAGRMADGTVTCMTGTKTVADHVVPTITAAASAAGRPAPRVIVSLPVAVTGGTDAVHRRMDELFALCPHAPVVPRSARSGGRVVPLADRAGGRHGSGGRVRAPARGGGSHRPAGVHRRHQGGTGPDR